MSFDYVASAATAKRLLTNFGQTVTRRVTTVGAYDPSTGTNTVSTADTSRIGALFDYKNGTQYVQGQMVIVGDKQLLLDSDSSALITDRWVIGSDEYTCVSVSEINPAGTVVMYDIHLRKA